MMTWSFNATGTPQKLVEALHRESGRLTGLSKTQFDEALPHLVGLIQANRAQPRTDGYVNLLKIDANGHGSLKDGVEQSNSCFVQIHNAGTNLLI